MIAIRLLGGAKKAVGKPTFDLNRQSASVEEILELLKGFSTEPRILQTNNLIVAVNGIDSAALRGNQTLVRSGDSVTIVTVVHGGTDHMVSGNFVSIIGVKGIVDDAGKLVDRLRTENQGICLQAVDAAAVYNIDHLLGILRMTLEAEKRKIMIANRPETELLLRLACTAQISDAISRVGLKRGSPACFIAFSLDKESLHKFLNRMSTEFDLDESILEATNQKKTALANILDLQGSFDDSEFLRYLLERAAILVKR